MCVFSYLVIYLSLYFSDFHVSFSAVIPVAGRSHMHVAETGAARMTISERSFRKLVGASLGLAHFRVNQEMYNISFSLRPSPFYTYFEMWILLLFIVFI